MFISPWNYSKVFNFDTFEGGIRKVYAKLQWRYCSEVPWLQYKQIKFEMGNGVSIIL